MRTTGPKRTPSRKRKPNLIRRKAAAKKCASERLPLKYAFLAALNRRAIQPEIAGEGSTF